VNGTAPLDVVNSIAAVIAAAGVVAAFAQLWMSRRQARATYEDGLVGQYRAIVKDLPIEALLGENLAPEMRQHHLGSFFRYFDLSNEQAFLFGRGRISAETWNDWQTGICQNLRRPAFAAAWEEISSRAPESFDELRRAIRRCDVI
jgi:hypothetical protein